MSFKLNLSPASGFALPEHHIIHVQGSDAGTFLQAQLMNDVAALTDGEWQYSGWLNPQGRVLALFQLARLSAGHFLIVLPALPSDWLIENLKRFVFRSKVNFSLEHKLSAQGEILPSEPPADAVSSIIGDEQQGYSLAIPHAPGNRRLHFLPVPGRFDAESIDQWHCLDMAGGWIWIDQALQALWTPQMLSLQRLNAFSLKKGCYPGQEIVARTHYLGKSKRQLLALDGLGLAAGQTVQQNSLDIGKVVNANRTGTYGVAVMLTDIDPLAPILNNSGALELICLP
ncbi:MAG: folate-binding protein YgfZ [Arenimonas sp.]|nr:folate-binding protein YgfZ [Arenimonas sp.]MBP7916926.1 folate-binding protein YgfZ [Arenimonas sp.]